MLKEANGHSHSDLTNTVPLVPGQSEGNGNGNSHNGISLGEIFKGQESMLRDLNHQQVVYLELVASFRDAEVKGDREKVNLLLQQLDRQRARRMAGELERQRKVIFEAIPLPEIDLRVEEPVFADVDGEDTDGYYFPKTAVVLPNTSDDKAGI